MTETIKIDGYTVTVEQDESPANPFKEFDCEPPTLTFYEGLTSYGDVPSVADLVAMIPDEHFARGKRVSFIRGNLNVSLKSFATERNYQGDSIRDAFTRELLDVNPEPSSRSWRAATDYFEMLEWLCKLAGIPACYEQSNGYSQGDSALVMAFATPEWVKKVGAGGSLEAQCKGACDLYSAWAWGDVYGIASITAPDGEELEDGSVWGFYGSDHKKSGLLESATDSIEYHKKGCIKEMREKYEMACRDIVTV
jgi:hypothetical protein